MLWKTRKVEIQDEGGRGEEEEDFNNSDLIWLNCRAWLDDRHNITFFRNPGHVETFNSAVRELKTISVSRLVLYIQSISYYTYALKKKRSGTLRKHLYFGCSNNVGSPTYSYFVTFPRHHRSGYCNTRGPHSYRHVTEFQFFQLLHFLSCGSTPLRSRQQQQQP